MPFNDFQKRWIVEKSGFDPNSFTYDEESQSIVSINPRSAQPSISTTPFHAKLSTTSPTLGTQEQQDTPRQTFLKTAAQEAPSALGGLAGAGLAGFAAGSVFPGIGNLAGLAIGIGGALGGSLLTKLIQNEIEPEEWTQNVEQSQALNPNAALLGGLATIPLSGFRPSYSVTKLAGRGALKGLARQALLPEEASALYNTALSAGIAPAIQTGSSLVEGHGIPSISDLGISALAGGLSPQANFLGERIGGFQRIKTTPTERVSADMLADKDIKHDNVQISTKEGVDLETTVRGGGAHRESRLQTAYPVLVKNKETGVNELVWRNKSYRLYPGDEKKTQKTLERLWLDSEGIYGRPPNEKAELEVDLGRLEDEGGLSAREAPETIETQPTDTTRLNDFFKAQDELRQREISAKSEAELKQVEKERQQLIMKLGEKGTAEAVLERSIAGKKELRSRGKGKELEQVTTEESAEDLEMRRLEGNKDLYQEESNLPTEAEREAKASLEVAGKSGAITKEWIEAAHKIGAARNIRIEADGTITHNGKPVAGQTAHRIAVEEVVTKLHPEKAAADTPYHEFGHVFINDLRNSPRARDREFVRRYDEFISKHEDYLNWKKSRDDQGLSSTPEEYQATSQGAETVISALRNETEGKRFWKDFTSYLKTRWGKHANAEDYRRILNYKLLNDPAFAKVFGAKDISGKGIGAPLSSKQSSLFDEKDIKAKSSFAKMREATEKPLEAEKFAKKEAEKDVNAKTTEALYSEESRLANESELKELAGMEKFKEKPEDESELTNPRHTSIREALDTLSTKQLKTDQTSELFDALNDQVDWSEAPHIKTLMNSKEFDIDDPKHWAKLKQLFDNAFTAEVKELAPEIYVEESAGGYRLAGLTVPASERGKGIGTKLVQDLIKKSEQNKKPIYLTASADKGKQADLNRFYERLGFEHWKDDPLNNKPMYRYIPKSSKSIEVPREVVPPAKVSLSTEQTATPKEQKTPKTESLEAIQKRNLEENKSEAEAWKKSIEVGATPEWLRKTPPPKPQETLLEERRRQELRRMEWEQIDKNPNKKEVSDNIVKNYDVAFDEAKQALATQNAPLYKRAITRLTSLQAQLDELYGAYKDQLGETPKLRKPYEELYSEESYLATPDRYVKQSFLPILTSRIDKIAESFKDADPTIRKSANYAVDKLHAVREETDYKIGQWGHRAVQSIGDSGLNETGIKKVHKYLWEMDNFHKSSLTLSPSEKKLFDKLVEISRIPREEQIKLGLLVKAGKGRYRKAGINPDAYFPNMIDPAVTYAWQEHPSSAKAIEADKMYVDWYMKRAGVSKEDAQDILRKYKVALGNTVERTHTFGAIRKAEGYGLPFEITDQNLVSTMMRYYKRAANDLAVFKHLENDDYARKILSLRDQFDKPPEKDLLPEVPSLPQNKEVQAAMRSIYGIDYPQSPTLMSSARVAANMVMGPGTAARNILNMPAFIAQYVQTRQLPLVAEAIFKLNSSKARAFTSGATKTEYADFDAAGYYEGNANPTIRLMNRFSEFMRKYQGRNFSDKFEGEFYYSLGELLAADNIARARNGNKESIDFVKKHSRTVEGGYEGVMKRKTLTQDDISRMAKAFVDSARGTYSESGLPSWAIEGQAAPFAALSRFALEKSNTIYKDVIVPMKKGNFGPMLRYTLGTLGSGVLIEKLNELLSNKRGQDPTIKEVKEYGNPEDVVAKAIGLLQLASFAGIIFDGAKAAINIGQNKSIKYNNPLSFPMYSMITDTLLGNFSDALGALREGEDPMEVLAGLATALSTQSVQGMRYVDANFLRPELAERKEKFRDMRVYNTMVRDMPPEVTGDRVNELADMEMKKFKRTSDVDEAIRMAPKLIQRAIDRSKDDPERLKAELLKLKLNSYQTMPNPKENPVNFYKYMEYIAKTQGEEAAHNLMIDFMQQSALNRAKSKLIPKL
jgi:GNAT superfamily N-acetyltransferase